jgi:tetratricopeptide (TPR) repeat protein
MASRFALIPFASRSDDDRSARIGQGLSLELADWLREVQEDVPLLTSAHTDEDGAWRKLVNFQDELAPSAVCEIVDIVRNDDEDGQLEDLRLVAGAVLDVTYREDSVLAVKGEITVTDVVASFNTDRIDIDLSPANFRAAVRGLFGEIAAALQIEPKAPYDARTDSFNAWLNVLITRALRLAGELGALDRDEEDLYRPAIEAAQLDPAFDAARERLGELAQVLVLERGFDPGPATLALDKVVKRVGRDWKSERVRGQLLMVADKPALAARSFCLLIKGKLEAPTREERLHAALMAGRAFNQASRHAEAQRVLGLAMQGEQYKVEAIVEAGTSSAGLGEALVAERLWLRAIELEKNSVPARLHLAHLYRRQGKPEKAAGQYEGLLSAPELPREVFADAAEFFVLNQMHETACATAERYATQYPGDAIAHVLLASSLNALGRHKRALKALDQAELCTGVGEIESLVERQRRFAEHPESEAEFRRLADEALSGDAPAAEAGLSELVRRFPEFWEVQYFLGVALRRQ